MRLQTSVLRRIAPGLLALVGSTSALAQGAAAPAADGDVHARMLELVARIERGLGRVDRLLSEAPDAEESLASRVATARARSRQVVEDIDTLLEIRHHPHGGSGGT